MTDPGPLVTNPLSARVMSQCITARGIAAPRLGGITVKPGPALERWTAKRYAALIKQYSRGRTTIPQAAREQDYCSANRFRNAVPWQSPVPGVRTSVVVPARSRRGEAALCLSGPFSIRARRHQPKY